MLGCHFYRQQVPNTNGNYINCYDYQNQLPIFSQNTSLSYKWFNFPLSLWILYLLQCPTLQYVWNFIKAFWYYHKLPCKQSYCLSVKWPCPPRLSLAIFSISVCVKGFPAISYQGLYLWRLWLLVRGYSRNPFRE